MQEFIGWRSRGYLPHFEGGEIAQHVIFRLADSLPRALLDRWRAELRALGKVKAELELYRRCEGYLDEGHGGCALRDHVLARMVEGALLFFDSVHYRLHAWVVMPNHVHTLFTPIAPFALSGILGSWKSYTSKEAAKFTGEGGTFWQREYFDRYIRSEEHFYRTVAYIEENPVKAGLCATPEEWPFGSARRRQRLAANE